MKKKYISPDVEIVSLHLADVLTASNYTPTPEVPTRAGEDHPPIDDL